jgi:hypothetical protein
LALKPHLRTPDQPKTKIDVVYGEAEGNLKGIADAARSIMLLEFVAQHLADGYVWQAPFTLATSTPLGFLRPASLRCVTN